MADNIVKRIIQMVLDKTSAKKTQDDVDTLTGSIDKSFKNLAGKIAGYFAVGFLVNAMKNLGEAAVKEASDSEKAWRSLKNTIDNTGASFDDIAAKIHATGDAFQDATIHDDDAFAQSLGRLVTLTGDVSASLNNMGLVANVAAKFFDGDLGPATDLVAKAMNGNVLALKKMGIAADDAQGALEILAHRSFGAAEAEAATFDGRVHQLNETWKDTIKVLGQAITQSDGATDSFSVLKAALKTLTDWIVANKGAISDWVTNGVKFAIDASDVLIRAIVGMTEVIGGGLSLAWAAATKAGEGFIRIAAASRSIDAYFASGDRKKRFQEQADSLNEMADSIGRVADEALKLGNERTKAGLNTLSKPLFSSDQFSNLPKTRVPLPGENNTPQVGKNVRTTESEAVKKGIKDYVDAGRTIQAMDNILGEAFDSVGAEIDRTMKLIQVFAENGIDPASQGFGGLAKQLQFLKDVTGPVNTALNDLYKSLGTDLSIAAINGATSLEKLQIQFNDVQKALNTILATPNATGATEAIAALTAQLNELKGAIDFQKQDQAFVQGLKDMGESMRQDVFFAALDAQDGLAKLQAQRQSLSKAIQIGIANNKTEDATFKQLVARYKEVTAAINEQTDAMAVQAAAADFLAEALGVALQGGIHEAAAQKAKQTGIEALEWLVRAGAYALFGNFAGAGGALKTAASFGAVSLAWGALAASTKASGGGSSGGGTAPSIPTSGGGATSGAGDDVSSARSTASDRAANAQPPAPEVSIYLQGPGFDMLNPQVQRVVHGASQQAQERYGSNAKVRVVPHGDS